MKCPKCSFNDSRVLDTRIQKKGEIRRRRECLKCKTRFSTIESILHNLPHVKKKDGCNEPFNKDKLRRGIQLACLKRPVSLVEIENIVDRISRHIIDGSKKEIQSMDLGQQVMNELKKLDDVAFVRFASIYRTFKDVQEFVQSLDSVPKDRPTASPEEHS